MLDRVQPPAVPACVWMNAGLLTYKLCDRNLDCEHCPLDAALRCAPGPLAFGSDESADHPRYTATFPDDRLYSKGHTWLQPLGEGEDRIRFGIDGFVASFMPSPAHVRVTGPRGPLHQGEPFCAIEFEGGALPLGSPVNARVSRWNRVLEDDPAAVVTAPYGRGWIAELVPAAEGELSGLLMAEAAREQARLDGRRLRRLLALRLLMLDDGLAPAPSVDRRLLTDLRQIVGAPCFVTLLQELIG